MLTIDDLKPKNFKITLKGVELESKPLKLSHALMIARLASVFNDVNSASKKQIQDAEKDLEEVIAELVPDLKDVQLDMGLTIELITQLMENIQPEDTKELNEKGVSFDADPKVERIG